ncbi:hypothetical protein BDR03DRAFT_1008523 [Suillus americanus]|nr:hypothetical protein BDR03DRAFT_1008523 [Suillus americanus]
MAEQSSFLTVHSQGIPILISAYDITRFLSYIIVPPPVSSPPRPSSPPGPPSSSPPSSPLSSRRATTPGSPLFYSGSKSGSSPNTMHSDLCASPQSTRQERRLGVPKPAEETDSILFDPSQSPNPERAARHQFVHDRMSKKQHPYPMYPAPIKVRYAARVMGREPNPYVSFESLLKHAGNLENGLAQLRPSTLYKGYKAKLAARETARQRLVVTAWEIEESERFTTFLDALHAENEERFGLADEELQSFRSHL